MRRRINRLTAFLAIGQRFTPPPPDLTIAHDTFTDADGTLLLAHTPEVGAAWVNNSDVALLGVATITGNAVKATSLNATFTAMIDAVLTNADCEVWADVVVVSDNNNDAVGVVARGLKTERTYYRLVLAESTDAISLRRNNNGVATTLATIPLTPTVGTYRIMLRCQGDVIKAFLDGVEIASVTDVAPLAGPGYVGVTETVNPSFAQGLSITEFGASYL